MFTARLVHFLLDMWDEYLGQDWHRVDEIVRVNMLRKEKFCPSRCGMVWLFWGLEDQEVSE